MNANEVLRFLTGDSPISMRVASARMGRSKTFLATTRQRGTAPRIDTMAAIADVYGYDLLLRNRADGDEVIIDPPE